MTYYVSHLVNDHWPYFYNEQLIEKKTMSYNDYGILLKLTIVSMHFTINFNLNMEVNKICCQTFYCFNIRIIIYIHIDK